MGDCEADGKDWHGDESKEVQEEGDLMHADGDGADRYKSSTFGDEPITVSSFDSG